MDVPVELSRIIISETSPQQYIFLKEKGGERSFPIVIGWPEAWAIDRRLKGIHTPRPLTHELLASVIEALRGQLRRIVIHDLREGTFIAKLVIERDGEVVEVDSRPSDAIALGVAFNTPIFVAEQVFEQMVKDSVSAVDLSDHRESLQQRRDELANVIGRVRGQLDSESLSGAGDDAKRKDLQRQLQEMQSELEAIEEILRLLAE